MEKEEKMLIAISEYLKDTSLSIDDLVNVVKEKGVDTSSSSIQRYLNDDEFIDRQFGEGVARDIKSALKIRKKMGNIIGGENSFKNNKPLKNNKGQFIGVAKDNKENKIQIKRYHCSIFGSLLLKFPEMNLNDIATYCNSLDVFSNFVTKSYVYDCLKSKYIYEVGFSEEDINRLNEILINNRYVIK